MYDYKARHYDPLLGRFTSPDTLIPEPGSPLAWDRYAYVKNNPVRFNDPTGHCIDGATTALCIAMAAGAIAGYALQVGENRAQGMDWGAALTTNISGEKILAGALIGGGVVLGAAIASVGIAAIGTTTGIVCADGDCTNEVRGANSAVSKIAENIDDISKPDYPPGTFSIRDWAGYPTGPAPKPMGPFRLLNDSEYDVARKLANKANTALHKANPAFKGLTIHEIHPIKFGGDPIDPSNKIALSPVDHSQYTNWWIKVQRMLE